MTRICVLMIGGATIAGCIGDSPAGDLDQQQVAQAELGATPSITVTANGAFHALQLANTNLCLRPQGGTSDIALVELSDCDVTAPNQDWIFSKQAQGTEIVNQRSGRCLYNDAPVPLFDGGQPIVHRDCNAFGTNIPASNALWSIQTLSGGDVAFMSRVQFRDTGFCLEAPIWGVGNGGTLQISRCNQSVAQRWQLR